MCRILSVPQTKRIMAQIQEKYGNQLEYLWENLLIQLYYVMKAIKMVCCFDENPLG